MSNYRFLVPVVLSVVLLAGCAKKVRSLPPPPTSPPRGGVGSAPKAIDITPLSRYQDEWGAAQAGGYDFADAYTRLVIYSDVAEDKPNVDEKLGYESRHWLSRALVDKDYALNLTVKVIAGAFEATVPLATVSLQSGSKGEKWARTIRHDRQSFPLFLVPSSGGAATPTLGFAVSGDRSYESRAAAAALQVALGIAKLADPEAPVVTTLTEKKSREQARAVDDAISQLFSSGLSEEHWTDRDLRLWSVDGRRPRGVKVTFRIPTDSNDWNSSAAEVGTWTVSFDFPRPSVFSDWRICGPVGLPRCAASRAEAEANALRELDPSQVLNTSIAPGEQGLGSIRAFIAQKDWYTAAQVALATPGKQNGAASTLCRTLSNEVTRLGLNGLDAAIVVWAVAEAMPLPEHAALGTAPDCQRFIARIEQARAL